MLILKTLALEPMHGWGIAQRIGQISGGVFQVNPGSLFPAFRRLERQGQIRAEWRGAGDKRRAQYYRLARNRRRERQGQIRAEWRASENTRRAKYYSLTETGRRKLRTETREWESQAAAI